jgi:hypothetical protein
MTGSIFAGSAGECPVTRRLPLGVIADRAQVHRRQELPGVQAGQPADALP